MRNRIIELLASVAIVALVGFGVHKSIRYQIGQQQLLEQAAKNAYVMMDTQVRIFHYVKPHAAKVQYCPECLDYKREQSEGTSPVIVLTVEEHERLKRAAGE